MIADRRALLRERLASAGLRGTTDVQGVPRRGTPERARLSFAQAHTWRYERAHPGSVSNNLGLLLTFTGEVDENALVAAMTRVVQHHEILRTTYHTGPDDDSFQRIHPTLPFPCTVTRASADDAVAAAQSALCAPFNLESDAPLRLLVFRTQADQVMAAIIVHHILWDGATFDVLSKELEQAYAQPSVALPDLPIQYADLAEWQRDQHARIRDGHLAYWTGRLAAPRPPHTLSSAGKAAVSESAGRVDYRLTAAAALAQLAARNKVTPFVAFLACWAAVLGREGVAEVTVGTTVLTRDQPGADGLIGNLANHIVLRLPVGVAPESTALVAATAREFDAALAHRDLPFEDITDALGGQDVGAPPTLFDSLVIFIPGGTDGPRLPGARTRWRRLHNGATQFPLVPLGIEVFVRGRGAEAVIDVEATYARNAFDIKTINELLARLDRTIHDAAREVW
ncbi:MAG: condensation domain-containing protein [Azospirillaceae bacterium]|nr:condensation domain-containing protein [Azospirillaceae bacterium]